MAYSDTLSGTVSASINVKIDSSEGGIEGERRAVHEITKKLTDGSGSNEAVGFFSSTFTASAAGLHMTLANSSDPLVAAGDDSPTSDPEGKKLKAVLIENQGTTNHVLIKRGTNGETSILDGGTDSIRISPGGIFLWYSPAGVSAMNDGTDDELFIQTDSDTSTVKITYIFG